MGDAVLRDMGGLAVSEGRHSTHDDGIKHDTSIKTRVGSDNARGIRRGQRNGKKAEGLGTNRWSHIKNPLPEKFWP